MRIQKTILPAAAVLVSAMIFSASAFAEDGPVIRENKQANTVEIVIDGKTVGEFTKDGLTIHGDVGFSGYLHDFGDQADQDNPKAGDAVTEKEE